jgi:hypothetical protein
MRGLIKMLTLPKNLGLMETSQKPKRKRIGSRLLAFIVPGAMVLMLSCLLPGCGSDSKPVDSVSGKSEKAPVSAATGKPSSVPLLIEKEMAPGGGGKVGQAKKVPDAWLRERALAPDEEIIPGMTRKEIEARIEASRKEVPPNMEVFPGMTKKEIEARIMAERGAERGRDARTKEVVPGVTLDELNAKRGREVAPTMQEMFPPSGGK